MSVKSFITIDILTSIKKNLQQPNSQHHGQFKNNYQPHNKDMQGNEVSLTSFLPKDATGCCTEKTIKYSPFINCSCKKSLEFASLHVRKKITDTAVTRAGLDGRQELLQTRMDLILEFHIPEILLIRKLLAPGVDSLLWKKILSGKRRHPESTGHFNPISSSCLFHRFWG